MMSQTKYNLKLMIKTIKPYSALDGVTTIENLCESYKSLLFFKQGKFN